MKYLLSIILTINILVAQENNTVKTSELELFLFKVGFESLLKDVEITKDKSTLNEEELKKLNDKVELIMSEIYKEKRVLKTDDSSTINNTSANSNEISDLRNEIQKLKEEIYSLKQSDTKIIKQKKVELNKKTNEVITPAKVNKEPIINILTQNDKIEDNTEKKLLITKVNRDNVRIRAKVAYIKNKPIPSAKSVIRLHENDLVDIDYCDNFSWCKLKGVNNFVPIYALDLRFNK